MLLAEHDLFCDTYWFKLALDTLGIEYKYNEYSTDDGIVNASIEFNIEDIKESCPTFYSFSKEIVSVNLCKWNALMALPYIRRLILFILLTCASTGPLFQYILIPFSTASKGGIKGSEYANATMKTIQLKIIKTAAWVKEMRTKIKIELPQFCTTKTEQIRGYERLIMLRT